MSCIFCVYNSMLLLLFNKVCVFARDSFSLSMFKSDLCILKREEESSRGNVRDGIYIYKFHLSKIAFAWSLIYACIAAEL